MLKASLRVHLFGEERNLNGNLKATTTQMKNVGLTFQFWTRLYPVLNIVGLGYCGENRIKTGYVIHILQWNGIHPKNRNKTVYIKPIL